MDTRLSTMGFRGAETDAVRTFQATYRRGRWGEHPLTVDGILGPNTAAALDHSAADQGRASVHFRYSEFRCKCYGRYPACAGIRLDRALLNVLEHLRREHYTTGLTVTSAYRCVDHNRAVGGATSSQHLTGRAADIPARLPRTTPLPDAVRGVGYNQSTGYIAHVDVRGGTRVTWVYSR